MARTALTVTSLDAATDGGNVLWSMIKGEQLEYPVTLSFIDNVGIKGQYTYEAVMMEAANISGDPSVPVTTRVGGVNTQLNIRVPLDRGNWTNAAINSGSFIVGAGYRIEFVGDTDWVSIGAPSNTVGVYFKATGAGIGTGNALPAYSREEVVKYNGSFFKYEIGVNRVSGVTPLLEPLYWAPYVPNKIYIQIMANAASVSNSLQAGFLVVGDTYTIATAGNTSWTAVGAANNNPGTTFVATGVGVGTGIALNDKLNWAVAPTVTAPVHGFFELRVTEPNDGIFQRTWKPIRGVIEFLFSPTDIVN